MVDPHSKKSIKNPNRDNANRTETFKTNTKTFPYRLNMSKVFYSSGKYGINIKAKGRKREDNY